jgi:hypothetical protein
LRDSAGSGASAYATRGIALELGQRACTPLGVLISCSRGREEGRASVQRLTIRERRQRGNRQLVLLDMVGELLRRCASNVGVGAESITSSSSAVDQRGGALRRLFDERRARSCHRSRSDDTAARFGVPGLRRPIRRAWCADA